TARRLSRDRGRGAGPLRRRRHQRHERRGRTANLGCGAIAARAAFPPAYRSGRVPHAFLIAGPKGIGKATLAYRMARFVLAHPDPAARAVMAATSLGVDAKNPV